MMMIIVVIIIIIIIIVIIIINIIQFPYSTACQHLVAYNRQALKVYITKAGLRSEVALELELDENVILGNKTIQVTR
jgi:hypothetical protein